MFHITSDEHVTFGLYDHLWLAYFVPISMHLEVTHYCEAKPTVCKSQVVSLSNALLYMCYRCEGTHWIVEQKTGLTNMKVRYTRVTYKSLQQYEVNLPLASCCTNQFTGGLLGSFSTPFISARNKLHFHEMLTACWLCSLTYSCTVCSKFCSTVYSTYLSR